jgi:serine/threonine protein phosphatase 1
MLFTRNHTPDLKANAASRARPGLSRLWTRRRAAPSIPDGMRIYAIGDIHGSIGPLETLLDRIAQDCSGFPGDQVQLVFLGDYIDRGPASRQVIERLMAMAGEGTVMLCGNHEDMLVGLYHGDRSYASPFHRNGGRATLLSYGVDPDDYDAWTLDELTERVPDIVPRTHIDFMSGLHTHYRCGDFFFVHAGVRPGVPLDQQERSDLLWIRERFSASTEAHEAMIVHGHEIVDAIEERFNRIAVDTGAYSTGRLSALVIEGESRRYLSS